MATTAWPPRSMYDHPFQWGSKRTGPDLARVGGRYSDSWHVQHLIDPRAVVPESVMPPYAFLAEKDLDMGDMSAALTALSRVGVPYSQDGHRQGQRGSEGPGRCRFGRHAISPPAIPRRRAATSTAIPSRLTEMDALVAYLQVLGTHGRCEQRRRAGRTRHGERPVTAHSTYEALRHFADSWGLLAMVVAFVALAAWPFRPGAKRRQRGSRAHHLQGRRHMAEMAPSSISTSPPASRLSATNGTASRNSTTRCRAGGCGPSTSAILFAIGYVIVYPAIPLLAKGTEGLWGWTSRGQLAAESKAETVRRGPTDGGAGGDADRQAARAIPN